MASALLDDLDVRILRLLNADARKSFREIAKAVDASLSTVSNRGRKLEEEATGPRLALTATDRRRLEIHHDDVLDGPHSLEREHNPAFGVRLEALRRRVLRRGDEDIGQLSALRVHNEVLDRSQDLTVVRHDGLASELCGKLLHPITGIGVGPPRHRHDGVPSLV